MGVLWVGYLPISIYLSFSPSKCVCATPTAKIRYSRLCWLSLVRAASRILILQAWRWGMNTCGARETHVLRFSDSPFLHPCAACLARTLLGARGVSLRREWNGNVPISHFIKHKHTLTNTRPLSLSPPPISLYLRFSQSPFLCRRAADFCNGQIRFFMHFGSMRMEQKSKGSV